MLTSPFRPRAKSSAVARLTAIPSAATIITGRPGIGGGAAKGKQRQPIEQVRGGLQPVVVAGRRGQLQQDVTIGLVLDRTEADVLRDERSGNGHQTQQGKDGPHPREQANRGSGQGKSGWAHKAVGSGDATVLHRLHP